MKKLTYDQALLFAIAQIEGKKYSPLYNEKTPTKKEVVERLRELRNSIARS